MAATRHWYPKAPSRQRPSPWWYFGWAAYVNRGGYLRALRPGIVATVVLLGLGYLTHVSAFRSAGLVLVAAGATVFLYSMAGIYRMYGHPARRYVRRLLDLGDIGNEAVIADLHIGTW